VLSNLALQVESVTIGWQIYGLARQTRSVEQSALLVGFVGLAQFVPLFLLSFTAGAMADAHDRRTIMLFCLAAEIACAMLLAGHAMHAKVSSTMYSSII
jgi:hypothetical protein